MFRQKPQESSQLITELTTHKRKSHTAGEKQIMSALKIKVSKMFGQDAV